MYPRLFDPRLSKSRKLNLESVERLKQNFQNVNPAVFDFSKIIPDAYRIKLLDTIVGRKLRMPGSDTNLIVCAKLKTIPR